MSTYVETGGIRVADVLFRFINEEVVPGIGVDQGSFWTSFGKIIGDLRQLTALSWKPVMPCRRSWTLGIVTIRGNPLI